LTLQAIACSHPRSGYGIECSSEQNGGREQARSARWHQVADPAPDYARGRRLGTENQINIVEFLKPTAEMAVGFLFPTPLSPAGFEIRTSATRRPKETS
jgi:hypothetical protein